MTTENKWIDAVGKLLQLTQERRLKWEPHDPPTYLNLQRDRSRVEVVYETRYNDKKLRLYQLSYKVEKPQTSQYSLSALRDFGGFLNQETREYPYWTQKTVLQLLDDSGFGAWSFPETGILDDLFDAVRYQVAGVKEFLDDILAAAS
jgi:hypothetical protein